MSKIKLKVNFHYGEQDFNHIMSRLVINKPKICDEKELMQYNKDTQLATICWKENKGWVV